MKLLLFVLFLAVSSQDAKDFGVDGSFVSISGIIDHLVEGLANFFTSAINDVDNLLSSLDATISNMARSALEIVFDLIDNLSSLAEDLLAEARNDGKVLDDCVNQAKDLELLKPKTSEAVEKCRENLTAKIASISDILNEEQVRGKGVISALTKSLQNCLNGSFVAACISKAQQSSLQDIQEIVTNAETLRQKISLASDEVANCLNDAEENGRQLANQIYQDIQQCISQAPALHKG